MGTIDKLIPILESKIQEGLEELPKLSVKTEDFTICLNNTLTAQDLLNRIMYKPAPKKEDLETITNS
jgi:hypothetical protein